MATRLWVSFWVLIFTLLMTAFEGVFLIHFVTRFTEEIFAFLIACVFLTDAFKKIYMVPNYFKSISIIFDCKNDLIKFNVFYRVFITIHCTKSRTIVDSAMPSQISSTTTRCLHLEIIAAC